MERAQRAKLWSLSGGSVGSVGKVLLNNIRIIVIEAKACFRNAQCQEDGSSQALERSSRSPFAIACRGWDNNKPLNQY